MLFQLIKGQPSLVEPPGGLVSLGLGAGQLLRPLDDRFPFRLGETDVANGGQGGKSESRVTEVLLLIDEKLPGLVLPPRVEHALQHDDALPVDLLVQPRLLQQRVQVGHGLFIELEGVEAESQSATGEIGLGMISVLLQEALELGHRNRIELSVVGGAGDKVLLEGRVILGLSGWRSTDHRQEQKKRRETVWLCVHQLGVGEKKDIN